MCLVDGHVHFHALFDAWAGIVAAADNFSTARRRLALRPAGIDVLMHVRAAGEEPLATLFARLGRGVPAEWSLEPGRGQSWLTARRLYDGMTVQVMEGQQVRTANGLEVLVFGPATSFEDGRPFQWTLDRVRASGFVAVVPWGFGKWIGARGREVANAVEGGPSEGLFLGDNASRPTPLPEPAVFGRARARGVYLLPGSDPVRVPGQERSMGSFGFLVDGFDPDHPWESVRERLLALDGQPEVFGARHGLLRSLYLQTRLRLGTAGSGPAAS